MSPASKDQGSKSARQLGNRWHPDRPPRRPDARSRKHPSATALRRVVVGRSGSSSGVINGVFGSASMNCGHGTSEIDLGEMRLIGDLPEVVAPRVVRQNVRQYRWRSLEPGVCAPEESKSAVRPGRLPPTLAAVRSNQASAAEGRGARILHALTRKRPMLRVLVSTGCKNGVCSGRLN
jgi:hypothetical protein